MTLTSTVNMTMHVDTKMVHKHTYMNTRTGTSESESESESDLIAAHYSDQYHLRRCSTPAMHTKKAIRKTKNHTLQELLS